MFLQSYALLAVLLNPFVMSIYLLDLMRRMERREFRRVLMRGAAIAGAVFALFAWSGDAIFRDVLQVRFAAFLVFGGLVFLVVALRLVFSGAGSLEQMRGKAEHIEGSIAMPFMIGPGTVSASVFAGASLDLAPALLAIACALATCVLGVLALKSIHDVVRTRNAPLVERYVEITSRVFALVIGSVSIEMIFRGVELWLEVRPST